MRKIILFLIFSTFLACKSQKVDSAMWVNSKNEVIKNEYVLTNFSQYDLDKKMLIDKLSTCGDGKPQGSIIVMPNPAGELNEFIIWKSKVVSPALLEKYPNLQTYQGVSKESDAIRIRIENKNDGIQAIVLGSTDTWYITPTGDKTETHLVFYKKDIPAEAKAYWSDKVLIENI
ncbi:MAG: hypothetical protein AAFQ94_11285 [Bacteroidota bacterium]